MKWYYNLKIRAKLLVGFAIVTLITALLGYIGYNGINNMKRAQEEIADVRLPSVQALSIINEAQTAVLAGERALTDIDVEHMENRQSHYDYIELAFQRADGAWKTYAALPQTEEEAELWKQFEGEWNEWRKQHDDIVALSKEIDQVLLAGSDQQDARAQELERKIHEVSALVEMTFSKAENTLNEIVILNQQIAEQEKKDSDSMGQKTTIMLLSAIVISIVFAMGLGIFLSTIISKPVNQMALAADKLSVGDIDININADTNDEIGILAKSFQRMIDATRQQVNTIDSIAAGKLDVEINVRSDNDILNIKLNEVVDIIKSLIHETNMLTQTAIEGQLDIRAQASNYHGDFRKLLEGINNILDAVIRPIKEAAVVLDEMAKGNLAIAMKGDYKGEHAAIKNALNYTLDSVSTVLQEIHHASEQVASGSKQVSESSQALSQGSTEQASAVEQITAAITEIAAQTKQNASNANQANELALTSKEDAEQGNKQMQQMLKAMEEINISSQNISKIIKVIDEIAFQTNILALNAAVEAARAGQHGKGFAVVAEEVRNLAARSANAAKETTTLIEGSMHKVETGTKIANETAHALEKIVNEIVEATRLIGDIAASSNEQATGIAQVNQAIAEVSQVVQTNSATSEEGAAASEELSSQAELLKSMVQKFKLKGTNKTLNMHDEKYNNPIEVEDTLKGQQKSPKKAINNAKIKISLDDEDFGKY